MKSKAFRISLLIAALSIATTPLLQAAPSLPITEPPVTSTWPDGPMLDPGSTNGQWFLTPTGGEEYRTHEFHDNLLEYGGGNSEIYAINGSVVPNSIQYMGAGGYGSPIAGFKIDASIYNDTHSTFGDASYSDNSHGEARQPVAEDEFYVGTLVNTKLTAEFAIADTNLLPNAFTGPYRQLRPYIIADNEEQLAWYCWSPQDPQANQEIGNYYVPTWDFGDIAVGQSASKTLSFTVDPPMDSSDPRYDLIFASESDGIDLFANRTSSLKISTWIDNLGDDSYYAPFPEEALRSSDVSVFHNEEPPYEPSHKMHYPQLPDPNGWDVRACYSEFEPDDQLQKVLADDFRCTSSGPITKITFWGSFRWDEYDWDEPFHGITNFHLSLHKDIPAEPPNIPYSMPELPAQWEWEINPYMPTNGWSVEVFQETPSPQGWYDPNTGLWEEDNHQNYFRYEVTIPESNAFVQTEGEIYWLDISVQTYGPMWGWKTTTNHWNDDAVWADLPVTDLTQWKELYVPPEFEESLDLAFVIDGGEEEPPPDKLDWGDAPDQPYPTRAINNGANHLISAGMFLGAAIDAESDGQPDPTATGDDLSNLADEDGVVFTSLLVPGAQATLAITASIPGMMDAWIDYNSDGAWTIGEQLNGGSFALAAGVNTITIAVPTSALPTGSTFARFRFSSTGGLQPFGSAPDGEVEDYELQIDELDWGDAPDPLYPTLAASGGANHLIAGGSPQALRLGWLLDGEPDGQPDPSATGDDLANQADEDGITFDTPLIPGTVAQITAYAGVNAAAAGFARLQGWIDFNADGIWGPAEKIFSDKTLTFSGLATPTVLTFNIPGGATPGPTFARFRLSTTTGLNPTGFTSDGEVEDYGIDIANPQPIDWGDAYDNFQGMVYPTLQMHNGAHHIIKPGMFLGQMADPEADGQPALSCMGDDTDLFYPSMGDDEDGVFFTSPLQPGGFSGVDVIASQSGILDAWIDFNNDGDWADSGEQVFTSQPLNPGVNSLLFGVPVTAPQGTPLVTRFRYSGSGVPSCTGLALDGEVEDHLTPRVETIAAQGLDFGDADQPYPTILTANGARHTIVPGVVLGALIDNEPDGQPHPQAMGDDLDLLFPSLGDDEDGVIFMTQLVASSNAVIDVITGISGGVLDAWIDFNNDGMWANPGEHLFGGSLPLAPGLNTGITFPVPGLPAQALGPTAARFRLSSGGGLSPFGPAVDGEVEDYMVDLFQPAPTNLVITNLTFNALGTVATNEWTVETGIIYQLESKTNLLLSPWMPAGSTVLGPANAQTDNMSAETNKFYRVTVPWTP